MSILQPFKFVNQGSVFWFALRTHFRVTSSNIGRALGLDVNESRMAYWKRAVLGTPRKQPSEFVQECMAHGVKTEPIACESFWTLVPAGYTVVASPGVFVHPKDCTIAASPDGLVMGPDEKLVATLEIKCPYTGSWWLKSAFEMFSKKPQYYLQVQAQLQCTGAEFGFFYVYWLPTESQDSQPEETFKLIQVRRDDVLWDLFINKEFERVYKVAFAHHFNKLRMAQGEKFSLMDKLMTSVHKSVVEIYDLSEALVV